MSPVLVPLFWALEKLYKFFFGRTDLKISKEAEEKFGHEILSTLPFLFEEYGGQLCRYKSPYKALQHPLPFDYAFALVTFDDLSLLFFRGRGDFLVRVAPKYAPNAWEELPLVLSLIDEGFERRHFSSLQEVATDLKPRMNQLLDALSTDHYPELQKKLANAHSYERAVIHQWETEINRGLYPDK